MRRQHTYTSPDHLYPIKNQYKSPYLSPKHRQLYNQSFKSPSSHVEIQIQNKFPHSNKYIAYHHQHNPSRNSYSGSNNYEKTHEKPIDRNLQIQISQLRLTISQLRGSLQSSSQTAQRLQQQLYVQRSKQMQAKEMSRRLEQQLKRMEFQLQRIGNYDTLEHRQSSIKMENLIRQNSKLSNQVNDLMDEIKNLKNYQRKMMTQCQMLYKEKQVLMQQNENLLLKLRQVQIEVREVKHDIALQKHQASLISQNNIPSRINNILTVRTQNSPTLASNQAIISKQSIQIQQLPQQIDYQQQNKKLAQNYQLLLQQNQSMKKLYLQFYKNDNLQKQKDNKTISSQNNNNNKNNKKINITINQSQDSQYSRAFSNKIIQQSLNKQHENKDLKIMLQSRQKYYILDQYNQVRDGSIAEINKCYDKALKLTKNKQANCLKIFSEEIIKNKDIYGRIAENYLKIRQAIKQQTGIKLPAELTQSDIKQEKQQLIVNIYKSTKQKARGEGDVGLSLAIFRLLTLLDKAKDTNALILDNIKHSTLKYIYKLSQVK